MSEDTNKQGTAERTIAIERCIASMEDRWPGHFTPSEARAELAALVAAPALAVRDTIEMAQSRVFTKAHLGLEDWKSKPHNAKWWKRIDGTPIPNDLVVCIANRIMDDIRALAPAEVIRAGEERDAAKVCQAVEGVENAMKARLREQYGSQKGDEYSLFEVICDCASIRFHKGKVVALLELAKDVHSHDAAIYNEGYDEGHADACKGILKRSQMQMFTDDQLAAHDAQLLEADHVKLLDYLSFHSRDSQAYADAYQKVGEWVCEWTPLAGVTNSPSQNSLPETVVRTASQRQFSEPELAAHDAAIRDPLLDVMRERPSASACLCPSSVSGRSNLIPFRRSSSKREVESPSNHQEFAREAEERLRRWDAALRSASVKSPTEKLYTESEVAAIRDEARFAAYKHAHEVVKSIHVLCNHKGPEWNEGYAVGINNAAKTLEMIESQPLRSASVKQNAQTHRADWNGQCVNCGADDSEALSKPCPASVKPVAQEPEGK